MSDLGIGLVNAQAADIRELTYPEWAVAKSWKVTAKVGTDEGGYDLYQLDRYNETLTVPANRLVLMSAMLDRMGTE